MLRLQALTGEGTGEHDGLVLAAALATWWASGAAGFKNHRGTKAPQRHSRKIDHSDDDIPESVDDTNST